MSRIRIKSIDSGFLPVRNYSQPISQLRLCLCACVFKKAHEVLYIVHTDAQLWAFTSQYQSWYQSNSQGLGFVANHYLKHRRCRFTRSGPSILHFNAGRKQPQQELHHLHGWQATPQTLTTIEDWLVHDALQFFHPPWNTMFHQVLSWLSCVWNILPTLEWHDLCFCCANKLYRLVTYQNWLRIRTIPMTPAYAYQFVNWSIFEFIWGY